MYSNRNERDFSTPFCTFNSGTRYSFISPGSTVNGEHVSATIAMATVVQTRFCLSCTLRLLSNVASTSCGLHNGQEQHYVNPQPEKSAIYRNCGSHRGIDYTSPFIIHQGSHTCEKPCTSTQLFTIPRQYWFAVVLQQQPEELLCNGRVLVIKLRLFQRTATKKPNYIPTLLSC